MDAIEELIGPGPGHNQPPSEIEILRQKLAEETAALAKRRDDLLAGVARAPLTIEDEETCGKVADLIKLITACHKSAETMRVGRKEPFLEAGRAVDGFFKKITEPLEKAKDSVQKRLTAYQRQKAEEERRRREDEARRAAEEAERQRKAAEEAAKTIETEEHLDAAIGADALARQKTADAIEAQRAADAKAAELSRTRGDYGAVASLRTVWVGEIEDRDALDLDALRPHLSLDAFQKAVNAFVRAGGRSLRGAKIYESQTTQVR